MALLTLLVSVGCDSVSPPSEEAKAAYAEEERQRLAAAREATEAPKPQPVAAPEPPPMTAKEKAAAEVVGRKAMASIIEKGMRDDGLSVIVKTRSAAAKTLVIRWDGCDDVQLDMLMSKDWFIRGVRTAGFKRVECDGGYQTWGMATW
jgi:hypothetical protein